jgi:type I restriction enzyme, S subunit
MSSKAPSDWVSTELGKFCSFRAGSAFKLGCQGKRAGTYPFIKVRDLSLDGNTRFIRESSNWVDDDDVVVLKAKPFGPSTVVFAKIGEALKANRFRVLIRDTLIDNNMMGATPNTEVVEPSFFYYLLQDLGLPDLATGSAMPYLRQSDLVKVCAALPRLDEQRRIAWVLSSLDDKIENNRQILRTLEEIAAALFKARLVDFVHNDNLVESEIGMIPQGWQVIPLSGAVTINPRVPVVKKGSVVPHVGMSDVSRWGVRPNRLELREYAGGARFEPGDTLMARITGCIEHGKGAFVDFLDRPGAGSTEFLVLRAKPPLTPEMVFLLSRTSRVREHAIANMSGSSGRQRVHTNAFDHIAIAVPPNGEILVEEASLFRAIFQRTRGLWRENRTLAQIRDALLPGLISGRLRVGKEATAELTT